jgi:hypothetical protein
MNFFNHGFPFLYTKRKIGKESYGLFLGFFGVA